MKHSLPVAFLSKFRDSYAEFIIKQREVDFHQGKILSSLKTIYSLEKKDLSQNTIYENQLFKKWSFHTEKEFENGTSLQKDFFERKNELLGESDLLLTKDPIAK